MLNTPGVAFDGCSIEPSSVAFQTVVIALGVNVTTAVGVVDAKFCRFPDVSVEALIYTTPLALKFVGAVPVTPTPNASDTAAVPWSNIKEQWNDAFNATFAGRCHVNPVIIPSVVLVESVKSAVS